MKYKVEEVNVSGKIPKVGEFWKHKGSEEVYLRIDTEQVRKLLGDQINENRFYSLRISSCVVVYTFNNTKDIEILQPSSVESDGTIVFKRV